MKESVKPQQIIHDSDLAEDVEQITPNPYISIPYTNRKLQNEQFSAIPQQAEKTEINFGVKNLYEICEKYGLEHTKNNENNVKSLVKKVFFKGMND